MNKVVSFYNNWLGIELVNGKNVSLKLDLKYCRVQELEPERGVVWTYGILWAARAPELELPAGMPVEKALQLLSNQCEETRESGIQIVGSGLGKRMIVRDKELDPGGYSLLYVLAIIADEAGANLSIGPSSVTIELKETGNRESE